MKKYIYPMSIAVMISLALGIIIGHKMSESEGKKDSAETTTQAVADSGIEWEEYLTLGEYKGLTATKEIYEVTDEEVEDQIEYELTTGEEIYEGTVKEGDMVSVDFVGTIDGEEFDGGSDTDYILTVGEEELLFDKDLIGKTPGDEFTVPVTFPDPYEYDESLSGQTADFAITVNYIYVETTEELTEEYAKETLGYDSVADYKAAIREQLEADNEDMALDDVKTVLFEQVAENCVLKEYPDSLYESYEAMADENLEAEAEQFGMDLETYKDFFGYTDETEWKSYVEAVMQEDFIFAAIQEKENISVSDEEYAEQGLELAYENGLETVEELEDAVGGSEQIEQYIIRTKILDLIYENAAEIKEEIVSYDEEE